MFHLVEHAQFAFVRFTVSNVFQKTLLVHGLVRWNIRFDPVDTLVRSQLSDDRTVFTSSHFLSSLGPRITHLVPKLVLDEQEIILVWIDDHKIRTLFDFFQVTVKISVLHFFLQLDFGFSFRFTTTFLVTYFHEVDTNAYAVGSYSSIEHVTDSRFECFRIEAEQSRPNFIFIVHHSFHQIVFAQNVLQQDFGIDGYMSQCQRSTQWNGRKLVESMTFVQI